MAASNFPAVASSPATSTRQTASFRTIAISLTLAFGIIAAAWAIGGRQGFGSIGTGGRNLDLLPKVGEKAPAFTALSFTFDPNDPSSVNLHPVDSIAFAGKPLWINFWASWCAPCRAELPDMKVAAAELGKRGMTVVAISLDEEPLDAALYGMQNNVTEFELLSDPNRVGTSAAYSVNNFPTHIFVDSTGIVRSVVLAPMSVDEAIANGEKAINPSG